MAAGEEWDAVVADPDFQKQPETVKNRVALAFFNQRLAPHIPPEHHEAARNSFFTEAFTPPPAAPQPSTLGLAGQAVRETLKEPVPYLAPVADAVRDTIPGAIAETGGKLGFPKTGAAIGTVVSTAGELIPKTGADLAIAGLGGPALEGAGALGAKAAPHVVSKLTGRSLPEAQRAISRAKEVMNPELIKPETIDNATQAIGDSIKSARSALGRRLGIVEDTAAAKYPGRILPTQQIADELAGNLQKSGIAADGKLPAGRDISSPVRPEIQKVIDDLRNVSKSQLLGPDGKPLPKIPRPLSLEDAIQGQARYLRPRELRQVQAAGLGRQRIRVLEGRREESRRSHPSR
jgi:hypothetical protein